MTQQWPPTPSVEDEEASLLHEADFEKALAEAKIKNQPAGTRGTVDQYPIIADVDDTVSVASTSTNDSGGPPTPTHTPPPRQTHMHAPTDEPKASETLLRPESPSRTSRASSRGRHNVPRIQTDLGSDLQEMITGRRRAPSPYAYKPQSKSDKAEHGNRFSGEFLLSPEHAKLPIIDAKRASSATPQIRSEDLESSTDSDRRPDRRRYPSRKRTTRDSFPDSSLSDATVRPIIHDARAASFSNTYPRPETLSKAHHDDGKDVHATKESAHADKRISRESSYTSSAEESRTAFRYQTVPHPEKRSSRDSPYTSSAEESDPRRREQQPRDPRSRRSSMRWPERPRLDLQGHHYSYGGEELLEGRSDRRRRHESKHHSVYDGRDYLEPKSLKSPGGLADYLEKAFKDNKSGKSDRTPRGSPMTSPLSSPPGTPPRTPRPDRSSKDYFAPDVLAAAQIPLERSRPTSLEGSHLRGSLKPLTAAIAAASLGKLATNLPPSLSRTSTSSVEKNSSGSTSKVSSAVRSRNVSPTRVDQKPISRANSLATEEIRPVSHAPNFPFGEPRPISRSGSYAEVSSQLEPPSLGPRTLSHSFAQEQGQRRPKGNLRHGQSNYAPVIVTEAASPKMSRYVPTASSNLLVPAVAPAVHYLAPCPRPKPAIGFHEWYTVRGVPELDICPTCMGSLGNSRFREAFIPSLPKGRNDAVQCALSRPWIRHAWLQLVKQRRHSLDVLKRLLYVQQTARPCPGRKQGLQTWYRLIDPDTADRVPDFAACSTCVKKVELLFPQLRRVFVQLSTLAEERRCHMACESKRFDGYMSQLDDLAMKSDLRGVNSADIKILADHARRNARVQECGRHLPLRSTAWHFIPQLPEFTICEECFQDVVWPLIKRPIARDVNRTLKLVPCTQSQQWYGISCQLYSDRMRRVFHEAVQHDDFEHLRSAAVRRYVAEMAVNDSSRIYESSKNRGIDRSAEVNESIVKWKQLE